jgi:nitroreductase
MIEIGPRLTACLEAAAAAPSLHNSQPWRFRISPGVIDVLVDKERLLHAIDPDGREAWISVGAAILNLRVALLADGRTPFARLLPDPTEPDLAARIVIGRPYQPDMTVKALASAIPKRRTNRRPFRDIEVRDEVLDQLAAAARTEGAAMAVADEPGRQGILGLTRAANDWQHDDPGYLNELRNWTDVDLERRDGIPARSLGPVDRDGVLPLRDFGAGHPELPRRLARFEPAPTVVVLYTAGDGCHEWLRAGQAMERVLLTATVRGVANTPMTAPIETPELRGLLTDDATHRVPQVILRLGYGDPVPATPRRPVDEMVGVVLPTPQL